MKGFAITLVLKQRQEKELGWPIAKHGEMPATQHSYNGQIGHYQVQKVLLFENIIRTLEALRIRT